MPRISRSQPLNRAWGPADEKPNSDGGEMSTCLSRNTLLRLARLTALGLIVLGTGCVVETEPVSVTALETEPEPPKPDHIWPPRVGERYPNLRLLNSLGERIALESLAGKIILVEPIGMDCPACNAFAGANRRGSSGFRGVKPQAGMPSIEEMLEKYAGGVSLSDDGIALVHLLLYRPGRDGPPSVEMARLWAKHFGIEESENMLILVSEPYLIGPASYNMIPGFQLIDADFVLRFDSSGHHPTHDLWRELLPAIPSLVKGSLL